MRNRYIYAYLGWLTFVFVCAAIAGVWYKHVEALGWRELGQKLGAEMDGDDGGNG